MFKSTCRLFITSILVIFANVSISSVYSNRTQVHPEIANSSINDEHSKSKFNSTNDIKQPRRDHYAVDPRATKRLALTEEHLVAVFSDILKNASTSATLDPCLRNLSKYLIEFDQDNVPVKAKRGILRADIVTENPNLVFRMIRRIVVTLLNDTVNSCKKKYPAFEIIINETFTAVDLTVPYRHDLEDALVGILRIQYVYGFNATTTLRHGIFNGVRTKALLYFEDCLALGLKAIQYKADVLAYQWLISAFIRLLEMQPNNQQHFKEIEDLEDAWVKLKALVEVNSIDEVHKRLRNATQGKFGQFYDYEMYATCRGEYTQSIVYRSKLRCFHQFDWDPYFYINPVKTEVLSAHPLIYQFHDFVSNSTINFIMNSVRNQMKLSGYVPEPNIKHVMTPFRTSINSWVDDRVGMKTVPKLVTLTRRFEKLTGLEMFKEMASSETQVVMYGSLGGHYDFHLDSLQGTTIPFEKEGDRMATIFMFFSDVTMGGYTAFPFAGTFAKPKKGSAIVWYNLKLSGENDIRTRHGGCPVILGIKEVGNRLILQYENMFKEPCTLDPNE